MVTCLSVILAGTMFALSWWPFQEAVVKRTVYNTYPLAAHGTVRIDSLSGDIRVTGYAGAGTVKVTAHEEAGSQDELAHLTYDADRSGGGLSIKANYPHFCSHCEISYDIQVPRGTPVEAETASGNVSVRDVGGSVAAKVMSGDVHIDGAGGLRVKTESGDISITGARGDIDARSASGRVSVSYASLAAVRQVALEVASGNIALSLPSNAAATIEASTLSGSIASDFGSVREGYAGASLEQTLGDGRVQVKVKAASGDITLKSI